MPALKPWSDAESDYKVWGWKHPLMLHMQLNPGLAFNEILLGQRTPARILVGRDTNTPLVQRQAVKCDACGALHDARIWGGKSAFGAWFGLYCPDCEARIPTLLNIFSRLIIVLTAPVWWPLKSTLRPRLVARNLHLVRERREQGEAGQPKIRAWKMGLFWGGFMFLIFTVHEGISDGFSSTMLIRGAVIWGMGGALFGIIMKLVLNRAARVQVD